MDNSRVSIIIPCYNAEKTVQRCLQSVLSQDWSNVEVIAVNDGSSDKTGEQIELFRSEFEKIGKNLIYVSQKNRGLGGAIDSGLKYVTGEYLCWFDADDFLLPHSIRKRAEYLDSHPQYGSVCSDAYVYNENNLSMPSGKVSDGCKDLNAPDYFFPLITGKGFYCAGCYMIRSKILFDIIPNKSIYPYRNGQNNQLLLPVYYTSKRAYIDEPLYGYIQADSSMSHTLRSLDESLSIQKEYRKMMKITMKPIPMTLSDRFKAKRILDIDFYRSTLHIGCGKHNVVMMLHSIVMLFIYGAWREEDGRWLKALIFKKRTIQLFR